MGMSRLCSVQQVQATVYRAAWKDLVIQEATVADLGTAQWDTDKVAVYSSSRGALKEGRV